MLPSDVLRSADAVSASEREEDPGFGRPTCYRCHRPRAHCYCGDVPMVHNRTGIVILQHPRERFHPIGTARIAALGLQNARVEIAHAEEYLRGAGSLVLPPNTGLLYPAKGSRDLASLSPAERPEHMVVIDGTWHHARTMFRDIPGLARLPRYRLTPPKPSQYRIRREPDRHFVSTIEAIVYCLHALEPDTPGLDDLLVAFGKMIDRQLAAHAQFRTGRVLSRRRPAPVRRLPRALVDDPERLLLVYGEAIAAAAPSGGKELVHWTARRLVTGEQFDMVLKPERELDDFLLDCMGLTRTDVAGGCSTQEFVDAWRSFVRERDVIVAWNQATLEPVHALMGGHASELYLKAAYHTFDRHRGPLEQVLAAEQLTPVLNTCRGRAGQRLGNAEALCRFLRGFGGLRAAPSRPTSNPPQ